MDDALSEIAARTASRWGEHGEDDEGCVLRAMDGVEADALRCF